MVEDATVRACLVPEQNIPELLAQCKSAADNQSTSASVELPAAGALDADEDEDELALLTEGVGRADAARPIAIHVLQEHIETLQKRYICTWPDPLNNSSSQSSIPSTRIRCSCMRCARAYPYSYSHSNNV